MSSYNKVLLMGRLTRDIELKYTAGGMAVANLGLAINRRYKTAAGEQKEEVCFVDCEAWGKTAETMSKYLGKGKPVFVEGRLKLDQWEDAEGRKHSKLRVTVEDFKFIDSKAEAAGGDGGPAERVPATAGAGRAATPWTIGTAPDDDPETPF